MIVPRTKAHTAVLGIAVGAAIGIVWAGLDARQQNWDHAYAVGYDEGSRGWYDAGCHRAVEHRWPRRFDPSMRMDGWLAGCLAGANDEPEPEIDWSTIGPPGPVGGDT